MSKEKEMLKLHHQLYDIVNKLNSVNYVYDKKLNNTYHRYKLSHVTRCGDRRKEVDELADKYGG